MGDSICNGQWHGRVILFQLLKLFDRINPSMILSVVVMLFSFNSLDLSDGISMLVILFVIYNPLVISSV